MSPMRLVARIAARTMRTWTQYGLEEGDDPAERAGAAFLGDLFVLRGRAACRTAPDAAPAAAASSSAAARGPARRRPRLAPWKGHQMALHSIIVTLPTLPRNVRVRVRRALVRQAAATRPAARFRSPS